MTSIQQELIPARLDIAPRSISLRKLSLRDLGIVIKHISDYDATTLGLSLRVAKDGKVDIVAFATPTHVFQVSLGQGATGQRDDCLARLLASASCPLAAFEMARLALHLYKQFGVRVHGVDLSTLFSISTTPPDTPAEVASEKVHSDVNRARIHATWYRNEAEDVCLRAWLSAVVAEASTDAIYSALKVDTGYLPDSHLRCFTELVTNVALLDAEKPTRMENEFEGVAVGEDGQLVIRNARYNTRVRPSKQTAVIMETTGGQTLTGKAVNAKGKQTGVKMHGANFRGTIERIHVIGREEPTHSERARDEFVLRLLQGQIPSLTQSPFVRALWFPPTQPALPRGSGGADDIWSPLFGALNEAQQEVVRAMWSDDEPVVVVHGPPGTGKTRTIAVALQEWDRSGEPAWVIAQSNVGVKNIARTLIKHNVDFKLIVSKEFHFEWHEHLYEDIERRVIRSDELNCDKVLTDRLLEESTVILCTVSMLSNPGFDNCGIYNLVPVERLLVDEASQIDSFEFMHLFHKFTRLHKVCMFGDPKQLPPFGKETAPLMKTIFDFRHLKPSAYFLNTQYRMPVPLGEFISEEVYNSKLKSVHKITDSSCVRFIDVRKGAEESVGSSWKNTEEVHAVVNIVKNYYKHLDFCIITPYDAQRGAIAQRLKSENLPWEGVYNVDSFQGHEAAYVIVSTVRTTRAGFLNSLNRMNVMLTRCQAGMVLVTNRHFLNDRGRETLLGKLARHWNASSDAWVDALALSDGRASLPGAPSTAGAMVLPGARASASWGVPRPLPTSSNRAEANPFALTTRAIVPATPTRPVFDVKSLFSSPAARGTHRSRDGNMEVSRRLASGVSAMSITDGEDAFPALGDVPSKKLSPALGRWGKGSEACRL